MRLKSLPLFFLLSATFIAPLRLCKAEGRIYVIRESDGALRFTNKEPGSGVKAEVFTAHSHAFSLVSAEPSGKIFPNIYGDIINHAAKQHQVDPGLVQAVIHVESAFNPRAVSPKGARGLMQLMPSTARELGVRNSFAPDSNIHGGTRYLAELLKSFDGNVKFALAAYNAGADAVRRYNGIPPYAETQDYVRRVLNIKKRYSAVRG